MKPFDDPAVLRLEQVTYSPGANPLFQDLSLTLPLGQCTVIMGPSGGGKSTLLRLGAGLVPALGGRVKFRGRDWNSVSDHDSTEIRETVGFAFQRGALWANLSVYENIQLPFLYHRPKAGKQTVRDAVAAAARRAGATGLLPTRPAQLSLGEQKLAGLARALVLDPEVIFLDDPTASLDPEAQARVLDLFTDLKRLGRTLVIVTQEPQVTARLADHLVLLAGGTILEQGPLAEVVKSKKPEAQAILTSVLSQAATYSGDILDLLSIDHGDGNDLK